MVSKRILQTEISIPEDLTPEQRQIVATRVVETIRKNTREGKDRSGKAFKSYTKEYAKTHGNTVDLTETGDTLTNLEVISIESDYITVGYPTGYDEADRIEGLVLGASGKSGVIGNPAKARDFIGLRSSEVSLIVEQVRSEYPSQLAEQEIEQQNIQNAFIQNILKQQGII